MLPHKFVPRQHGSRSACGVVQGSQQCGAAESDEIHVKKPKPPKPSRWHRPKKGQALVEMALITPVLLLMILGIFWIGYLYSWNLQLIHAATEGAVAGALNPGDSCGLAQESAEKVYALTLDSSTCSVQGQILELTVADSLSFPTPWGTEWTLRTTQRAVLR